MDLLEGQRICLTGLISAVFQTWESQLLAKMEECNRLRSDLQALSKEISGLRAQAARIQQLGLENDQLRQQLEELQQNISSTDQMDSHQDLLIKHSRLVQEDRIKQAKIGVLESQLNRDRQKLRKYVQYTYSPSPAAPIKLQGLSPNSLGGSAEDGSNGTQNRIHKILPSRRFSGQLTPEPYRTPRKISRQDAFDLSILHSENLHSTSDSGTLEGTHPTILDAHREPALPSEDQDLCGSEESISQALAIPQSHSTPLPQLPPLYRLGNVSASTTERSNRPTPHPIRSEAFSPQAPRSSSTAPSSQGSFVANDPTLEEKDSTSSDGPEVLGARSVSWIGAKDKVVPDVCQSLIASGGTAEAPVLVKSEPPTSFQDGVYENVDAITFSADNLDSVPSRKRRGSPGRIPPPHLVNSHSSGPVLQMAIDQILARKSNRASSESADSTMTQLPSPITSRHQSPLKELDVNDRVLPKTSNSVGHVSKKRKSDGTRGIHAIPIIAEDGEYQNKNSKPRANNPDRIPPSASTSAHHRLVDLLTEPSPLKTVLLRPTSLAQNTNDRPKYSVASFQVVSTPVTTTDMMEEASAAGSFKPSSCSEASIDAKRLSKELGSDMTMLPEKEGFTKRFQDNKQMEQVADTMIGNPRTKRPGAALDTRLARPSSALLTMTSKKQSPAFLHRRTVAPGPEDLEPFRSRPLNRLNLSHFKVNPQTNDGVDYAYTEVVRKQEQRKCLPGCTRLECCGGKFRTLALTLPDVQQGKRTGLNLDRQSSPDGEAANDGILREFLGPGKEEEMRSLTRVARENLLVEAKTKIAADKYGKMHRHAHERAKSPEWFWRTEMPGTQEEEQDRKSAQIKEREEVEKRYREACREGGRWIFADE